MVSGDLHALVTYYSHTSFLGNCDGYLWREIIHWEKQSLWNNDICVSIFFSFVVVLLVFVRLSIGLNQCGHK